MADLAREQALEKRAIKARRNLDRALVKEKAKNPPLLVMLRSIASGEVYKLEGALHAAGLSFEKLVEEIEDDAKLSQMEAEAERIVRVCLVLIYVRLAKAAADGEPIPHQMLKLLMERCDKSYLPKSAVFSSGEIPDFKGMTKEELAGILVEGLSPRLMLELAPNVK